MKFDSRHFELPPLDFWQKLFALPPLDLVAESCRAERRLHGDLALDPLRAVKPADLAQIRDEDARRSYTQALAFRDAALAAGSLEAWYLQLIAGQNIQIPPLFIDLAVQQIMQMLLCDQAAAVQRAGELFYRPQRVAFEQGRILCGDRERLDTEQQTGGLGELGRLLKENKMSLAGGDSHGLQVLNSENAADFLNKKASNHYAYNWLLDLTHEQAAQVGSDNHAFEIRLARSDSGLTALSQVMQIWLVHMLGLQTKITPLSKIEDKAWRWHTGLDVSSSELLNALYQGQPVHEQQLKQLISLFRLDVNLSSSKKLKPEMQGRPVYLGLAIDAKQILRFKPQNLLLNLPL